MDFVSLNDSHRPDKLIQNYDSLIWTERFNTVGDFQLVTSRVDETLELLPEDTPVSLLDTDYTMIVETHRIERKKNQPAKLTVTGRSFESVLDRRVAIQSLSSLTGTDEYVRYGKTPAECAAWLISDICGYGSIQPGDAIPLTVMQCPLPINYGPVPSTARKFIISRGNLLTRVLELLQTEGPADPYSDPPVPATRPYGIRPIRPSGSGLGTAIVLRIHDTRDLSATVHFDAHRSLLDDGTYLFSKIGSANVAYGVGYGMAATMHEGSSEPTGLSRRVILIDSAESDIGDQDVLRHYMSQELAYARETAIFDGSINPDINPYVYGTDYNLGDMVKLEGDYGLVELARVTEYIRTDDATGEKSYPTLQTIVP